MGSINIISLNIDLTFNISSFSHSWFIYFIHLSFIFMILTVFFIGQSEAEENQSYLNVYDALSISTNWENTLQI